PGRSPRGSTKAQPWPWCGSGGRWSCGGSSPSGSSSPSTCLPGGGGSRAWGLVQLWQDFQQAGISVERLGDVLNTPLEPHASGAGTVSRTTLPNIKGQVTFDQVLFRYRADAPPVLQGLSFGVPPGTVIGIVGRSGS